MGYLGNGGVDIARTDNQVFDGHFSSPSFCGEDVDKTSYSPRAVHFDDTIPVDNEFESQAVDLAGETQVFDIAEDTRVFDIAGETQVFDIAGETRVFDIAGETQVFDIAGETQVFDIAGETQLLDDPDYSGDMDFNTQILSDFDDDLASDSYDDGIKRTEILVSDDLSGNESFRSFGQSVDQEKNQFSSLDRKGLEQLPDNSNDKKLNSGSMRLTSIRAASLRASGLAARNSALLNKDSENLSVENNHIDRPIDLGQSCDSRGQFDNFKRRVGSSTVRKLFTEDSTPVGDAENRNENPLQLTACDDDQLAVLSYIDSQEPGDLTQADALDFVDKLLKDTSMEFDEGVIHEKETKARAKLAPNPKGHYGLANIVNRVRTVGESRVFDWDDNREDEGGGNIFCRRKEEFFGNEDGEKIPFTEPRTLRGRRPNSSSNKGGFLSVQNTKSKSFFSDSSLRLSKERENSELEADDKCGKNLRNKSDEQQVFSVGFDTQMAAEAMEALFNVEDVAKYDNNEADRQVENSPKDSCGGSAKPDNNLDLRQSSSCKRGRASNAGFVPRQSKRKRTVNSKRNQIPVSSEFFSENLMLEKGNTDADETSGNENMGHVSRNGGSTVQKKLLSGEVVEFAPVAHRTRQSNSVVVNQLKKMKIASSECEKSNHLTEEGPLKKKRSRGQATGDSKAKKTEVPQAVSCRLRERKIPEPSGPRILKTKSTEGIKNYAISSVREQSYRDILAGQANPSDDLLGQAVNRRKRSCNMKRARSLMHSSSPLSSNKNLKRPTIDGKGAENAQFGCTSADMSSNVFVKDSNGTNSVQKLYKKIDESTVSSVKKSMTEESPRKKCKPSDIGCTTPPDDCRTPTNAVSPVCMGNEYYKQSCKKSLSKSCLLKELRNLSDTGLALRSLSSESRKRKDMNGVRVLYSNHLDEDIIKQQKKTLARLGITLASSITEATHFIADKFVRTRNMLEAIALGKLVVTHLWIESCGQASCFIDEKNYILRDAKKEKEFGFSMPATLACARQHPLLQGRRVLITQNTKPGKDIISSLVKAVNGQAVERIGRSALKDDQIPDDLLVLSCEEDYDICMPFLERGAAVYSSELLLNGIVTQKLEFERHRLFADHVKRTRSTIWLKKDGNKFHPVSKHQ